MNKRGQVILVGAGPGNPDLLTLGGKQALEAAEVVFYDRLVGEDILHMIPASAEKVDVGKASGRHPIPQEEINKLLLQHALAGKRVVRLKGGDPFLFGRGAEELELLAEHGIPFQVVPGVTAAISVPAYGGIPVTHRDFASSVHVITGHSRGGRAPDIPYKALAELGGTLVFLMSVAALEDICGGLLSAGMSPDTPAALVENGTLPVQRKITSTLAALPEQAADKGFGPPSVLVVGGVCSLAEKLDWSRHLPLWGKTVLVTRPKGTGGRLAEKLRQQGCRVVEHPCVLREPIDQPEEFWKGLSQYAWIVFTSPFGAKSFLEGLYETGKDARALSGIKLAAVGAKTAAELRRGGLLADLVPPAYDGESLGVELRKQVNPGERVLLFRAKSPAPGLAEELTEAGILFDEIPAYETVYQTALPEELAELLRDGNIDYAAFTSASTVKALARSMNGMEMTAIKALCIGETTAKAARALGMDILVSKEATLDSMVERLIQEQGGKQDGTE